MTIISKIILQIKKKNFFYSLQKFILSELKFKRFPKNKSRALNGQIRHEQIKTGDLSAEIFSGRECWLHRETGLFIIDKNNVIDEEPYSYWLPEPFFSHKNQGTSKEYSRVISFLGPFKGNYCHFILHCFIALPHVRQLLTKRSWVAFDSDLKKIPFIYNIVQKEYLSKILWLEKDIFVNEAVKIKPILDSCSVKWCANYAAEKSLGLATGPSRVFLVRRNANRRILANESAIISLLKKFKFQVLDCSLMGFDDQLTMLRDCEILIAVHGAAATNLLFASNIRIFLEIKDPRDDDDIFYKISTLKDIQYHAKYGLPLDKGHFLIENKDLIDLGCFLKNL